MPDAPDFTVSSAVARALVEQPIVDIHTHLYPPQMGSLCQWGPDDLVTYHYLKAEVSRQLTPDVPLEDFHGMPRSKQADVIWKTLFVGESSPVSEAQLGVITVMKALGLELRADDLSEFRAYCAGIRAEDYVDLIFEKSGVASVLMTNDPLDDEERPYWENGFDRDPRFGAVLRLDSALIGWPAPAEKLKGLGYDVAADLSPGTVSELRRYLSDWCERMDARYMAISLPPFYTYPDEAGIGRLMHEVVYPTARERGIPSAMMIGVNRQANPVLRDAGDSLGKWNIENLERIAREWPDVKFLVTLLSRENQHELAVTARKFPNVEPFGCWWFLNNPSIIEEITSERLELLGTSFVPQHSDARILDQLLYKWTHSLSVIGPVLSRKYESLAGTGWPLTEDDIRRDVSRMFGGGRFLSG